VEHLLYAVCHPLLSISFDRNLICTFGINVPLTRQTILRLGASQLILPDCQIKVMQQPIDRITPIYPGKENFG
jgi:hypothetical protein